MKMFAQIIIDDFSIPLGIVEPNLDHLVINGQTVISNGGIHGEMRELLNLQDAEADNVVQLPDPSEVN